VSLYTRFDARAYRLDLFDHARRMVVLEVEHARGLAATHMRATLHRDHDDIGGRHAVTGDVERRFERIPRGGYREYDGVLNCHQLPRYRE